KFPTKFLIKRAENGVLEQALIKRGTIHAAYWPMNEAAKLVYLMVQGEERGPFALEQVRTMYETGLITPLTMFKNIEEWQPLVNAMSGAWEPAQPPGRCF